MKENTSGVEIAVGLALSNTNAFCDTESDNLAKLRILCYGALL